MTASAMEKFAKQLRNFDDAVDHSVNMKDRANVLRSTSPYLNWTFANHGAGIPKGLGMCLYGPAKGGKSLITGTFAAGVMAQSPDELVIKFNTEMRGNYQKNTFLGVDPNRMIEFDTNEPTKIFNRWNKEIVPMLKDGMKVGLAIFDSINGIRGIKGLDADDIDQHLIGDKALTLGTGFEMILSSFREFKIPYILTAHIRANIDTNNGGKGPKEKMAAPHAIRHMAEYFMSVRPGNAAEDKVDSTGEKMIDTEVKDARGDGDKTGHKVYFRLEESSLGTSGRAGQFIIDYKEGLTDIAGQYADLLCSAGVFERQGTWYVINKATGEKVNGKKGVADLFRAKPEVAVELSEALYKLDFVP